ncbi:MAG TPA: GNAT family N-acetyltransferase [Propionibacteriaceae bacterium]|nr:GNAT family N-acetyltransferase [Propionibacteriaceae bacterium]
MDLLATLTPAATLGDRLVLRTLLDSGSATDVIGWLTDLSSTEVTVAGLAGSTTVRRSQVVAARLLPPALGGPGPMRTGADELEQIALPGWLAESEPLGEWTLRYGGGFTGRANSCLAVGESGVEFAEAARRVVDFAARHGIPPRAQVVVGSPADRGLTACGWREVYVRTDVLAGRLTDLLGNRRADAAVEISTTLSERWLQAYRISRPDPAEPAAVRAILDGQPPRIFASVTLDGRVVAIARAHVHRSWMGASAIWTAPQHRRLGWATKVILTSGHWAARQGARNVYLQVAAANATAHEAYGRLGFRLHHSYRYLAP